NNYRYRLAWADVFGDHTSEEIRVTVPRPFAFSLIGAQPNPSRGTLSVAFELPEPSDVRLELFDLLGRRVRDVHAPYAAGPQLVSLDHGTKLAAGLYQVRLQAGGREARLSVIVLR